MKNEFKKGYDNFKIWHTNKLNIFFHFLTSVLQIYFVLLFLMTFNFWYVFFIIIIPYITDGIGHLIEKNFTVVLLMSKALKSSNSSGVNGFYNFLYRIMVFKDKFLNK